ncbi:MAG: single-stranded-DNA-specific exonuclease RecJ, nonfunctional, partial [Parcubacteria group bacterium GW2011_GWF2_44_8]
MSLFEVFPVVSDEAAAELGAYGPHLQTLLFNRGITTKAAAEVFLSPSYETQLHDPFLLHDMDKAVERVL